MKRIVHTLLGVGLGCILHLPVIADDEPPSAEEVLAHPNVKGALAVVDAWLEAARTYERVPGISAGIVYDQDLIWSSGYGYSNLESQRPADADTLYSICSISKLFTSIGVMQLRDAGELTLRDPVGDHLDWFNISQAFDGSPAITIEGLLTHSSGLPRESDFPYWNGPDFPFPTREQVIDRLGSQETLYPAESLFQYSNLALTLAGEIIQAQSGMPYDEYIQANILEPLGLDDTRTFYPEDLRGEELAIGYTGIHRDGRRDPVEPFFTRGITPAAGFTSSVNDLAAFASWQLRLLDKGGTEVLDANTLREMHRVQWVDPDWETTWGLGFVVWRLDDMTLVGHSGGCPGYITSFTLYPKGKLAAIVLTNAGDGPATSLSDGALKVISGAVAEAGTPPEGDMPDYSMYEGNFVAPPWGGETAIRQWGDQLVAVRLPSDDLSEAMVKLEHSEGDTFLRLSDDGETREPWVFELGEDGKAARIFRHSIYLERIE
jgi:CubicO group peptidase (beta-lactamase class C family)